MSFFLILSIAFALSLDAFSAALAAAAFLGKVNVRQKFRLSFHFGLFQFLMPLIGWAGGTSIVHRIEKFDHWIAFSLLFIVGIKMIIDSQHTELQQLTKDVSKGWSLVSLSVATSIDALAVGFSFGIINARIVLPAIIIGIVASAMTLLGIRIGSFLSAKFGVRVSVIGGMVLIGIGVHIVLDHLSII